MLFVREFYIRILLVFEYITMTIISWIFTYIFVNNRFLFQGIYICISNIYLIFVYGPTNKGTKAVHLRLFVNSLSRNTDMHTHTRTRVQRHVRCSTHTRTHVQRHARCSTHTYTRTASCTLHHTHTYTLMYVAAHKSDNNDNN